MSLASDTESLATNLAAAWDAVVTKGGTRAQQANLYNIISALNPIGTPTDFQPISSSGKTDPVVVLAEMKEQLARVYNLLAQKRATIPPQRNFANLAAAILSIPDTISYVRFTYSNGTEQTIDDPTEAKNYMVGDTPAPNSDDITAIEYLVPMQNVNLGSSWTVIASNLPKLTHVEGIQNLYRARYIEAMLSNCPLYNEPLVFPTGAIEIHNLLNYSDSFNQPIVIPNSVTKLGDTIMHTVDTNPAFSSSVTIPNGVDCSEITRFLEGQNNFTGPLVVNTTSVPVSSAPASNDVVLIVHSPTSRAYTQGIQISGSGSSTWKAAFPDRAQAVSGPGTASYYRKLVLSN